MLSTASSGRPWGAPHTELVAAAAIEEGRDDAKQGGLCEGRFLAAWFEGDRALGARGSGCARRARLWRRQRLELVDDVELLGWRPGRRERDDLDDLDFDFDFDRHGWWERAGW
jgi:hypothetical protein